MSEGLERPRVELAEISRRLREVAWPEVQVVVAIATGGLVPGAMVAHQLGVPMRALWMNYRAPGTHEPCRPGPEALAPPPVLPPGATRLLLVDDVSVSGQTLEAARSLLPAEAEVTTFVLKGRADRVLFPGHRGCVTWPWSVPVEGEMT